MDCVKASHRGNPPFGFNLMGKHKVPGAGVGLVWDVNGSENGTGVSWPSLCRHTIFPLHSPINRE